MSSNLGRFSKFAIFHKPERMPWAKKAQSTTVASKLRASVRAYLARPRLHQGSVFEPHDYVYAAVLVAALVALAGWR